jgi:3'(2'), 5'-bisphosphate nucleotidase
MDSKPHMVTAIQAAIAAGNAINAVYHAEFAVKYKSDQSPLTLADQKSHEIITAALKTHNLPILSEEGQDIPYAQRKNWQRFWMVDPLDGTKEFIKRNGEFTVNIALIEHNRPTLGTIFVPDRSTLYFAERDLGAFKLQDGFCDELPENSAASGAEARILLDQLVKQAIRLPVKNPSGPALRIVGSRSHKNAELEAFVEAKRQEFGEVEFISAGSSLKICLIAEGQADLYPRLGPTMEWDTAAGQAIAEGAGASVVDFDTQKPLVYNKEDLHNPWFIVQR